MNTENQYYPFSLSSHSDTFSLLLTQDLKWDLFEKNNFLGNGYDWTRLIENLLKDKLPNVLSNLKFDSEAGMFCVYSKNKKELKEIAKIVAVFYDSDKDLDSYIIKYAQYE